MLLEQKKQKKAESLVTALTALGGSMQKAVLMVNCFFVMSLK